MQIYDYSAECKLKIDAVENGFMRESTTWLRGIPEGFGAPPWRI